MRRINILAAGLSIAIGISAGAQVCAPPVQVNTTNACDDGSSSGTPSLVASSVTGATAQAKFQNVVNKKLACCLNSFDPSSPATPVKYDCVDNTQSATGSFDNLWAGSDPADSGSQSYAVALTIGGNNTNSGQIQTGFFTLTGARCAEYSELAGTIRAAKVNAGQSTGQLGSLGNGSTCAITPQGNPVTVPANLVSSVVSKGKKVPYDGVSTTDCLQSQAMRRCPILVRAALVATCPRNPALPQFQTSYQDGSGITHCTAASSLHLHIRMEQIYEIAGEPTLPVIDTIADSTLGTAAVSTTSLIQTKVGNACPTHTYQAHNACEGCPDGCGNTQCSQCPANTYYQNSAGGAPQCRVCPNGTHSLPGSAICS